MRVDEALDASPGVVGRGLVLCLLAVEEAVRRALVGDDLVLDAGGRERAIEGRVLLGRDVRVVAGLERKDWRLHLRGQLNRSGMPVALPQRAVEADRAREPVFARRGEPGMAPAEAEPDRENALARAALG